ncbi:hypothetical protein N7499_012832 [Penicillium canescens]|nr:hypothetical protein N7499_012832 [Penicillium canescens]KAJ6154353.1 hypothetical protein N7485_012722 [Penicillium canescens]
MDVFNLTLFALCGLLLIHISTVSGAVVPAPLPGTDGICYTYIVQGQDTCTSIGKQHSITMADIEAFNKNSWEWLGCDKPLYQGAFICLSAGAAPMPVALPQATCGPQVPGTTRPSNFDLLGALNPCPNKECCAPWGICGTTPEFCSPSDYTSHTTSTPTHATGKTVTQAAKTTQATTSKPTSTTERTSTTKTTTTSKSTSTKTASTTRKADKTTKAAAATETYKEPWTVTLFEQKDCVGNYYLLGGYNSKWEQMNPSRCLNLNGGLNSDSMGTETFCKFYTEGGLHSTNCDNGNFTAVASWVIKNGWCYTYNLKGCSSKDHKDSWINDGGWVGCENHGPRHSPHYVSMNCFINK